MTTDFYQILGVPDTASRDEIKKAYRRLAALHHPDKGGDTAKFQSITQAYNTLGDESLRAQYDYQKHNTANYTNNTGFHFNSEDMADLFQHMFAGKSPFEHAFRQQQAARSRKKNRDVSIRIKITFNQSYTGVELEATYQTLNGNKENVFIKVPAGIQSGQTIRYRGLGDDTDPQLPCGDLNVTIMVEHSQQYVRRDDDLLVYVPIHPIEAMIGCAKEIVLPDNTQMTVDIPPGVQPGTEFVTLGCGFTSLRNTRGNLLAVICVQVPAVLDPDLKTQLEQIYTSLGARA